MPFPAEGAWPVVVNADLPFVVAVHEASRRLDMPAEVAREALRHAIRNKDVIVCTPVTADGETTYVHIEDYSVDAKYEPDVVVDATTFDMWLIDRQRDACKQVLTPMIGGSEARSLVEKAALYDKATAEQWLRRQIRVGCFPAVQGAHNIWLEGAKTDTRPVTSVEIDAGIGLDELSVAKEAFLEVLAAEFPAPHPAPGWPRSLIPGAIARAEIQKALRYDAEASLSWLKLKIRQGAIRARAGSYDVVYHDDDTSEKANTALWNLEHPIASSDFEGDRILDWSTMSVDKQDLDRALAAETTGSDKPVEAQVAPAAEEEGNNKRNAGRKPHKSIGQVMAMAGAWLEEQDYSAGDEMTEPVMAKLRKAMSEFAQHLEDEDALDETLSEAEKRKAPSDETIRKWSHSAMEAHREWREFRKLPRN
jgi:hypothetical protein